MAVAPGDERERLLDPVDRISEVLFGLIMAVTIVGSLSFASAGVIEMRTATFAALGCNLAWGLVDAVMYLVRAVTQRVRLRSLGERIRVVDAVTGARLVRQTMPDVLAGLVGPAEIEVIRRRILARPVHRGPLLRARDFLEAFAIFLMVVLATFPVVLPFLLLDEAADAIRVSQLVSVAMLMACGYALGRYAGHPRPLWTGTAMAVFGAMLIVVVKLLGG